MTTLDRLEATNKLDFRKTIQLYRDTWRGYDRVCRYKGQCILCGVRIYGFDDGEDDPRGPLGRHAECNLVAEDYGLFGPEIPCCFDCQNDTEERYNMALNRAKRRWRDTPGVCFSK